MRPHRCLWVFTHTHTLHTQISFANSKEIRSPDPNPSQLPTLLFSLSFESINHDTAHKASNHTHTPNRFSFLLILFLILFSLFEGVHPSPYIQSAITNLFKKITPVSNPGRGCIDALVVVLVVGVVVVVV